MIRQMADTRKSKTAAATPAVLLRPPQCRPVQKFDSPARLSTTPGMNMTRTTSSGPTGQSHAVPHRLVDGLIEESVTRYNYEYYDNSGEEGYGGLHIETIIDPDNNRPKPIMIPGAMSPRSCRAKTPWIFVTL